VTAFLDTNVLIRHLTGDPPDLAARATAFLADADELLLLPDLIVAETVYVLESFYEVAAEEVARLARSVIAFPAIRTLDPGVLLRSLEIYETHRIDFAEAYLVASAESAGVDDVVSFDRSIDRVTTVNRIEP
jgi:predicted nucleic acid-binding protein